MNYNFCEKFIAFIIFNNICVNGWDLTGIDESGLNFIRNNNEFNVIHVSVFYLRAFLTIRNRWNITNSENQLYSIFSYGIQ